MLQRAPGPGALIVEDDAAELQSAQVRKGEFLDRVQALVCETMEPLLSSGGWTTDNCPYVRGVFLILRRQSAVEIEQTLRNFAPGLSEATSVDAYLPAIVEQVTRSTLHWVQTGEITGLPEGVPGSAFSGEPSDAGAESALALQRKEQTEGAPMGRISGGSADPSAVRAHLGPGRALDSGVRGRMERSFGQSFGDVRIHVDPRGAEVARSFSAKALTVGEHIAFGSEEYAPGSLAGDALIAHELAHTLQQRGAFPDDVAGKGAQGDAALEHSADRAAERVTAGAIGIAEPPLEQGRSGLAIRRCQDSSPTPQRQQPAPTPTRTPAPSSTPSTTPSTTAPTGRALPLPDAGTWRRTYASPAERETMIRELMTARRLPRPDAERLLDQLLRKQGQAMEGAHTGLADGRYSWDLRQDIVIGQDRQPPNCFGDVCRGARERWEPSESELNSWLSTNNYVATSDCSCREGVQTVAVYTAVSGSARIPIHIAELQPDCRWRSRMGDLGVLYHERPDQLWPNSGVQQLVGDPSARRDLQCYARARSR